MGAWFSQFVTAFAVSGVLFAGSPVIAEEVRLDGASDGSPVATEVIGLVDKYFLDRSFNGVNLKKVSKDLEARGSLTDEEALELSTKLVKSLGDRYSRIISPAQAGKLSKYDVTGVGINLVIADNGDVKVGAVPPENTDAGTLGIKFGDVVVSINGRPTVGMTSFDALEAIQSDGDLVRMEIKGDNGKGPTREVALRKAFQTKNPVSYRLVASDNDKSSVGYIKLSEFNAQCKRRVREAVSDLERNGASSIVLDLRGNAGGVLDGALGIAGLFIERPLVLYVTDANGSMQPLYSREQVLSKTVPLQVWVDQSTASSGEVLAAALRDVRCLNSAGRTEPPGPVLASDSYSLLTAWQNCRASLVGGTTYGKGVIQGVFGLSDGGALIETVASYSTPARDEINRIGVKPDETRTFVSDVLGSSFVDQDVKAANFARSGTKVCKVPSPSPQAEASSTLLAQ